VKILSKIRPEDCSIDRLLALRARLHDSRVRRTLAHLPVINDPMPRVLYSRHFRSVTTRLLWDVAKPETCWNGRDGAWQLLVTADQLQQEVRKRRLPKHRFHSTAQLQRFVETLQKHVEADSGGVWLNT